MRHHLLAACVAAPVLLSAAYADTISAALDHAPIGVMGDHTHKKGEWMFSYRLMQMQMEGNRVGESHVSPTEIVTGVENPFGMPPYLRVVPEEMSMTMHMLGAMYAPSDRVTLMAMVNYTSQEMDHLTYQGMMGSNLLGTFSTSAEGFGDVSVTALVSLFEKEHLKVHGGLGLSLPTGSIEQTDAVLTPMNMQADLRLPYPMQLGSGTYDLKPSLTLTNKTHDARFGGGVQYSGIVRLDENDAGYTLGDRHELTAWGAWSPDPRVSFSLRSIAWTKDSIDGDDALIRAPVQTANPDFHGGEGVDPGFGMNLLGTEGAIRGYRLGAELVVPVKRDLNGPQLETDWTATLGLQKAF
ncbi:hypothetical protein [Parvularcula sp. LCG005]|uniref:hypothetical protein n=1 Tax=Parvularcula sp. LCG005 TaxID=3078805 RepID=UPI002943B1A6|nr:hypothetical protein [Parvularcula sp. LCG005]WOI54637.1 hypothetical protein RUI03_06460 [Parvularcula sp. LCG005]